MIKKEGTCKATNIDEETSKERRTTLKDLRRDAKERKYQKLVRKAEEKGWCIQEEIKRLKRLHLVTRVF